MLFIIRIIHINNINPFFTEYCNPKNSFPLKKYFHFFAQVPLPCHSVQCKSIQACHLSKRLPCPSQHTDIPQFILVAMLVFY